MRFHIIQEPFSEFDEIHKGRPQVFKTAAFICVNSGFEEDQELRLCSANCPVCAAPAMGQLSKQRKLDSLRYTGGGLLFHTTYSFKRKLP